MAARRRSRAGGRGEGTRARPFRPLAVVMGPRAGHAREWAARGSKAEAQGRNITYDILYDE